MAEQNTKARIAPGLCVQTEKRNVIVAGSEIEPEHKLAGPLAAEVVGIDVPESAA
jgi:hypothetical protein